jgi:hypothetical protein
MVLEEYLTALFVILSTAAAVTCFAVNVTVSTAPAEGWVPIAS